MRLLRPEAQWIDDHRITGHEIVLAATRDELAALAGAINEAIEAVEDWEFQTRLGVTCADARSLRSRIVELLRETYQPE